MSYTAGRKDKFKRLKMKKILFMNHSWNLYRTKSSIFLVDFLKEKGFEVDIMPFEQKASIDDKKYYAIIFFQYIYDQEFISKLKCKNIIFVPMYDWYIHSCYKPLDYLLQNGIKILNFSRTLQQDALSVLNKLKSTEKKQSIFSKIFKIITGGGGIKLPYTLSIS